MTRSNLVGGLLAAFVLAAPVLALVPAAQDERKTVACAMNLKTLWMNCFNYAAQYGRPNGLMPTETGSDFWLKLKRTPKPLVEKADAFFCPLAGHDQSLDQTSYRGPAKDVNRMEDKSPVGADFDGNHGVGKGGNVLTKEGDINHYKADDPMWKTCESHTAGTPPLTKAQALEKRLADLEKAVKELTALVNELKARLEKGK